MIDKLTLQQRISLWKALPHQAIDENSNATDEFINDLVARIEELEKELEEVAWAYRSGSRD